MNCKQLKELVIEPILRHFGLHSKSAVNLLLGTCAQESKMGEYISQLKGDNSSARGIYQIEPVTEKDILRWLANKKLQPQNSLTEVIRKIEKTILRGEKYSIDFIFNDIAYPLEDLMITDLVYATIMARLFYWRIPEPLPEHDDIEGMAAYWKKYYNTELGKGTVEQFVKNYKWFVL